MTATSAVLARAADSLAQARYTQGLQRALLDEAVTLPRESGRRRDAENEFIRLDREAERLLRRCELLKLEALV